MSSILDALRKKETSRPEMRPLGPGSQGPKTPDFRRNPLKLFWLVVILTGIGALVYFGLNHVKQNSISREVSNPVEMPVQKEIIPDQQKLVQIPTLKALSVPEPTIISTPVPVIEKPVIVQEPIAIETPLKVQKIPENRSLQKIPVPSPHRGRDMMGKTAQNVILNEVKNPDFSRNEILRFAQDDIQEGIAIQPQPNNEPGTVIFERGISMNEVRSTQVEDIRDSGIAIQGEEEVQGRKNTSQRRFPSDGVKISEDQIQILPVESKSRGFQLNGIMYDDKRPLAIINGRLVGVGDRVEGHKVLAIGQNSVRLEDYESLLKLSE